MSSAKADKKNKKNKAQVEETEDAPVEEEVAAPVAEKKNKKKNKAAAEPAQEEEAAPAEGKKKKKKAAAAEEAAEEPAAEEAPKKNKKNKKAKEAEEEEEAPAPAKKGKKAAPAADAEDDDDVPVPTPKAGTKRAAESDDSSAKKSKTEDAAGSGGVCCFLTGLSYNATDDEIAAAWEGVESVDIFKDPEGNSKGRGKVYFDNQEHAQAAIATGGATIAGRFTGIREWTDNGAPAGGKFGEKRGRDGGNAWGGEKRQRFDDSNAEPSLTVFVRNLSYTATDADIMKAWKGVQEVDIFKDPEGNSKGGGKVTFDTLENAKKAVEAEGTMIAGRQVGTRYWTASAGGDRGGRGGGFGGRGGRGGFDRGGRGGFDRGGRGRFGGRDGGRRGGGRGPSVNSTPAGTKTTFGDDSD